MELIYKLINTSLSSLRFDVMILAITQNNGAVFASFLDFSSIFLRKMDFNIHTFKIQRLCYSAF